MPRVLILPSNLPLEEKRRVVLEYRKLQASGGEEPTLVMTRGDEETEALLLATAQPNPAGDPPRPRQVKQ